MGECPARSGRSKDNLDPETLSLGSWQRGHCRNSGPVGKEVLLGAEGAKHREPAEISRRRLLSNHLKNQGKDSN